MPYKSLTDDEMTVFLQKPEIIKPLSELAFAKVQELSQEAHKQNKQVPVEELIDKLYTTLGNAIQERLPDADFETVSSLASYLAHHIASEVRKAANILTLRRDAARKIINS